MDPQHRTALPVPLQRDGVVQVLGAGAVDGDDGLFPQVKPSGEGLWLHRLRSMAGLLQHLRGKFPLDILVKEDGLHRGLPTPVPAKDLQKGTHRGLGRGAVAAHLDCDPVAGVDFGPAHDLDGRAEFVPGGDQPDLPAVLVYRAGDGGVAPAEHGGDMGAGFLPGASRKRVWADGDVSPCQAPCSVRGGMK